MSLRAERETLVDDPTLGGAAFGHALAALVDGELVRAAAALPDSATWALVALGSYARRELCPGSDIDVMLLHAGGGRRSRSPADDAGRLWYPLWDGGFVLGHSVRTVKEALDLADADLDAMTALLDVRLIIGDARSSTSSRSRSGASSRGAVGASSSSWRPRRARGRSDRARSRRCSPPI